ncbi:MAG: hypothetical protein LBR77_03545 [Lachnospiraceae bacterium]|jgi:hypothetical protein|nr:hypothetical protein [Lachnospiraceae bacterium]
MEKVYRTMKLAGVSNVIVGIVIMVVGLSVGVIAIVSGAYLLRRKSEVVF